MPQVVEAEVIDAGALLRLVPRSGALLDALTAESEALARVLPPRRFERRNGDGQYFDASNRNSVNNPIRPFKHFPNFVVDKRP
jgi:hypothetical protein